MGLIRLGLAFLVLLSHLDYSWYGYNPGVMAVVVFYLLAGHVVAKLWRKAPSRSRELWFYRDRALRILPQYYVSLACATVLWWWLRPDSYFVSATPTLGDWVANLTILPLNYFMFNGVDTFTLLAPAWSLAVELQFYLLVPVLLISLRRIYTALAFSLVFFVLAQMQWLHPDVYGYRLLIGIGWVFLSGALCMYPDRGARYVLTGLWLVACTYLVYLLLRTAHNPAPVLEVAVGYVVGLPCVYFGQKMSGSRSPRYRALQHRAGIYSYGVFLIHFPVFWLVEPYFGRGVVGITLISIICLLYAEVVFRWLERPLWQRLRPLLPR